MAGPHPGPDSAGAALPAKGLAAVEDFRQHFAVDGRLQRQRAPAGPGD
jgi:hypothetical protein